jgi:4-hydroxy-tetrahydrodipicolinate synthase
MVFSGSMVAIVTPMADSGELDFAAWERLLEWHVAQGTDAIVVAGTTGESPTVTLDEARQLVQRAVAVLRGRIPVIAGSGTNSTATSVERTQRLAAAGADAVLTVTPYYNKPTQEGLYRHFTAIADASPVPMILYNVPSRTGVDLLPDTVARLAPHPRIAALKEATGDLGRMRELVTRCGQQLALLSGDDPSATEAMLNGARGIISVTANVAPAAMRTLCVAALQGDAARARELDARLRGLHEAMFIESNPIPVKWAVQQLGLIGGGIRLPLVPLSPAAYDRVRSAMQTAGISCDSTR